LIINYQFGRSKVEKAEPIENEIFEKNIEKDKRRSQKATEGKGLWKTSLGICRGTSQM